MSSTDVICYKPARIKFLNVKFLKIAQTCLIHVELVRDSKFKCVCNLCIKLVSEMSTEIMYLSCSLHFISRGCSVRHYWHYYCSRLGNPHDV